jgi:hypothetical protein
MAVNISLYNYNFVNNISFYAIIIKGNKVYIESKTSNKSKDKNKTI